MNKRFMHIESALQKALGEIKSDIKVSPSKPQFREELPYHGNHGKIQNKHPVQKINGHIVKWETTGERKIPIIQTETFYVQYPSKPDDVELPKGCVRASYDSERKCVDFFEKGNPEPIKTQHNQRYEGLPYPRFMTGLEKVEEIIDLNLETGEITTELSIDVLDEFSHWFLRLREYEEQSVARGIKRSVIDRKLARFTKALKTGRGVDILDPQNKIAPHLMSAIQFIKLQQARR